MKAFPYKGKTHRFEYLPPWAKDCEQEPSVP